MLRKETKGREKTKGRKKKTRNFCIKFVAFDKRCQCCKGDSEESHRSQGFGSEQITKLRRQDEPSTTEELAPLELQGCFLGRPGGKGNKFHMLERGNFQEMVFLLLTPAERWLCTFPGSCRAKSYH